MKKLLPVLSLFLIAALGLRGEGGIGLYIPVVGDYVTAAGATNVAFMVTTNLAPTLHVSHADTATAILGPDGSTLWKVGSTNYVVTPDTNRVYIVSASGDYNGVPVGEILTLSHEQNGEYYYGPYALAGFENTYVVYDPLIGPSARMSDIDVTARWIGNDVFSFPGTFSGDTGAAAGTCVIDYVPVTNITVDVSEATVLIIAAQVETNRTDIAALEAMIPAAGCTANGAGATLTITGAPPPIAWQAVPSGALAVSVAANAPRNRFYSITAIGKAVSAWPAGALVSTNSSGTSPFHYAIGPYTGALWQVVGGGR